MKIALDTNVLAYAEGLNGTKRQSVSRFIIEQLREEDVYLPVQVLGELLVVLMRKGLRSAAMSRDAVLIWQDVYTAIPTSDQTILSAIELVAAHRLAFWDAVILAAAAEAGCRFLLSEDMHPGFTWRSTTIANPFAPDLHPLLAGLIRPPS